MIGEPSVVLLAFTWVVWVVVVLGIGRLITRRNVLGMWWMGLVAVTAITMALGLLMPLGSPPARVAILGACAFGILGAGVARIWRMGPVLIVVSSGALVLSVLASVVPSNYDTGLYHIGSILYARDGGVVIGLANVHDRLGFSSFMWPLSASLGLGVWNGSEFRLVNGLLLLLVLVDVAWRGWVLRQRTYGMYVLSGGSLLVLGAVIQYPGRLIASSAQDLAAALLMIVSAAYLLDFLKSRNERMLAVISISSAALAGAMRPIGWVFCAVTVVVVLQTVRAREFSQRIWFVGPGILSIVVLFVLNFVRDVLTSGWVLFPLGLLPISVPWRYPDPGSTADDIAAWARTPFGDTEVTLANNDWLPGWFGRLWSDWSIVALVTLVIAFVSWLVISPRARSEWRENWRSALWALVPVLVTLATWFVSAPDPRFAWGAVLLLGLIPVSVLAQGLADQRLWVVGIAASVILLAGLALARGSLNGVSFTLAPPPEPEVSYAEIADGSPVTVPVVGDQCWARFPMCRPWYSSGDIQLRGSSWREGFEPVNLLR